MRFIFDRKDDIYKLGDIIEAFENKPKYEYSTIKPPPDNFRNMDGLFDKLVKTYNEEALIIVSSGYCRAHTGKSVMQWDKQPVVRGGQSIFITPSIAFLMRREADLMDFAKVISSAMYLKSTGGEGKAFAEEVKVRTKTDIDNCIIHVKETGVVAFDFETYVDDEKAQDYEWYRDDFHASLLSITPQPGISYTIPLKHFENPIPDSVREYILKQLNDGIFNNPDVRKIGWNVKFDMHVAKKIGMDLRGRYDDPMVMYSILDNTVTNRRLKQVAGEYFPDTIGYDTEVGAYRWKEVPLDILSKYAASDTSITILLAAVFEAQMDETLTRLYRNIVAPGTKVLFEAEHRGMDVDIEVLNEAIAYSEKLEEDITKELMSYPQVIRYDEARIQREIDKAIKQDKAKIHKWESEEGNKEYYIERAKERIRDIKTGVREVAKPLNLASVPMMKGLLYSKEGFGFKTKIKNTAEATLVDIKDDTGFIDKFLLRRKLAKNRSTYLEGVKKKVVNGRVHTSFHQHRTDTGRLSSSGPNLQNLPNEFRVQYKELAEMVRYVKKSFVAPEGKHLLQFDLSQAELRFMAEFSKDETMVEAYKDKKDLHAIGAAHSMDIPIEEWYGLDEDTKSKTRFHAKARNFGLLYLMSVGGYQKHLKEKYSVIISRAEAARQHEGFFRLYPGIRKYHKIYEAKAKKFGKVRNWFGRQRILPNISSRDEFLRSLDIRAAINMPIQGTAGDYLTMSMVLIRMRLGTEYEYPGYDVPIQVNSIHDAILVYSNKNNTKYVIREIMGVLNNLPVEEYFHRSWDNLIMESEVEISDESWADIKEIKLN